MSFQRETGLFLVSFLLLVSPLVVVDGVPSLKEAIRSRDQQRLLKLFESTILSDLETTAFVAGGIAMLGGTNKKVQSNICSFIKKANVASPSEYFYATLSLASIKDCDVSVNKYEKPLVEMLSSEERNSTEVYWIASSLSHIGAGIPKSLTVSRLASLADKEEAISRYGHIFMTGALLKGESYSALTDLVEDAVAQADEAGDMLYYEGGLSTTSNILTGIFRLAEAANTAPAISLDQATQFGNYILSSKDTSCICDAFYLMRAANLLANNKFTVPASLQRTDFRSIDAKENTLKLRLSNILDGAVGQSNVVLKTAQDPSEQTNTPNKPLKADSNGLDYSLSLSEYVNTPGNYLLTFSTEMKGTSPVASLTDVQVKVTVGFSVGIDSLVLSVIEKDQNVAVKSLNLQYPTATSEALVADHLSKVKMTFDVINEANKQKMSPHQVFVRLLSADNEEIFFVATPSSDMTYVFELDVAKSAKESFNHKSGLYDMTLVVGGAVVQNPFTWDLGKLTLKFSGTPKIDTSDEHKYRYKPRPEIQHMFQQPEKLPPTAVSMTFSALVLLPLAVLLITWLIMGINLSNISVSGVWGLIFHVGLASIFVLFYLFWVKMNMFQTLKWLTLLGGATVFAGNQMLRRIAKSKTA